ncbi:MAG: YidC/Oxa1 family insertase periplasmic-domain containing protein, partial [Candidatus Kapaibacterium sp.]
MDRNSILAIILISLLILGYMFYSSQNVPVQSEINNADSTVVKSDDDNDTESLFKNDGEKTATATNDKKELQYGKFQAFTQGTREIVTIESDLYIAKLSSKGGDLISWELKNYNKWDGVPTQLINDKEGELYLDFISAEGKDIDSRNLYFTFDTD